MHLEADIDIGTIDGRTPPKCEATIGNLVQTRPLSIGELLVTHRLFESGCFLPEQSLPSWEVCSLEQCVLKNTFDTAKRGNNINTIIIELPKFAVMTLGSPPERITVNDKSVSVNPK